MTLDQIHAAFRATESSLNKHYWILYSIAHGLQARTVFEFGAGLSSAVLVAALEPSDGRLISCDTEPLESLTARMPSLRDAERSGRWDFRHGDSSDVLGGLGPEAFELVLHDGAHEADRLERDVAGILPRLRRFGILLVHDVEQFELGPQVRRGLMAGIRQAALRVSMTSLPYSDGLAIVRMEDDTGHGRVMSGWCKATTRPAVPTTLPW